jgi:hypothetical protein
MNIKILHRNDDGISRYAYNHNSEALFPNKSDLESAK